jgi:acyl-coenzyme A synthetase/AMP-(fatty) acid ligase
MKRLRGVAVAARARNGWPPQAVTSSLGGLEPGARRLREGGHAAEADIIAFARERLAHFKAPRGITFVGELPKTATGKIQKYVLRKGAPNLARQ